MEAQAKVRGETLLLIVLHIMRSYKLRPKNVHVRKQNVYEENRRELPRMHMTGIWQL